VIALLALTASQGVDTFEPVDPAGIDALNGGGTGMASTNLAIRYVAERQKRGEISQRTATTQRRVLLRFAGTCDHVPLERLRARHVQLFLEAAC